MRFHLRIILSALCALLLLSSCATAPNASSNTSAPTNPPADTLSPSATQPARTGLWIDASVPAALRLSAESLGLPAVQDSASAALILEVIPPFSDAENASNWTYALVAPFPTLIDDISSYDLRSVWAGTPARAFGDVPLLMDAATLAAFTVLWGEPAKGAVRTFPQAELLEAAWESMPAWAIVPFDALEPRWKVLSIDGQSPVRRNFDPLTYPLMAGFHLRGKDAAAYSIPLSNRDPEKLTTIIMTGVTALVRATAKIMETKGILYPGRDIRDWMREADIAHISNEIPFYSACAYPNPSQRALVFCSSPRYIDLLTDIGTDVIELTGNHFGDYGEEAMMETLAIYQEKGIPYYGGGKDLADARKPLMLENHGNKIAFVGCNPVDVNNFETAKEGHAGANPCNMQFQAELIKDLKEQGYLVIATFQYYEYYSAEARPYQQTDFRLMADSGASIVSGSQAHFAQVMEFRGDSFIHYGLGNLFFDQMGDIPRVPGIRRIFLDRHIVYDGKYISTELLTGMMEDHARPRPMAPNERVSFLQEYFTLSGWLPAGAPTPTPLPTFTLTPIDLPTLPGVSTSTPVP